MPDIYFHDNNNRKQLIDILYENEQMIVVNKTAGIPVIPDRFGLYNYNLRDLVSGYVTAKDADCEVLTVHRIDVDTSGVVIFAKSRDYHRFLNSMFEERTVKKKYWAIVSGQPLENSGKINRPLKSVSPSSSRMAVDSSGKEAETLWNVLEKFEHYSLLELQSLTGRTHQIRVHLKALGTPLAIDPLYGSKKAINLAMIKTGYRYKENQTPNNLCDRLTLHAHSISFNDPISKKNIHVEAGLTKDFKALLNMLRKWSRIEDRAETQV